MANLIISFFFRNIPLESSFSSMVNSHNFPIESSSRNLTKTEELAHFIQKLVEEISTMLNRVEDEKKESARNEQVRVPSAKEENAQALALQTYAEKEFVLTLDHSNFSETISTHEFVVVEFYAPWCEHSKKLAPEYEKAASILSSNHPRVILAKVDADKDANKELSTEHDIKGFPTLKIFRNEGEDVYEYNGPLDSAEGIVEYLKKQNGPASAEIKSAEEASGLIGDNSLVVVGVFPKFSGEEYDNFTALAEKLRSDYEFAHTRDAKLLPRGESSVSGPLVRLFKPFDELFVDSKDFNVEALEKFVEESSLPVLTLLNTDPSLRRYTKMFFNSQNAKAMLFMNFNNEAAESMKAKYHEVAENFKGHGIIFLLGDIEASEGAFKYLGLKEEQVPVIVAVSNDERKYLKVNIDVDDIAPWMKDYKDGKVAPYTKSEPIPHDNNENVKVVVADSIDDVVFKSGKNVLIEFYAPWCAHCKKLAPVLDEVALSFESDPNIVIAKFDATANDIISDAFDVNGFPTVYFRSSTGTIFPYDGDRTKEDIIDFIEKNRVAKPQTSNTRLGEECPVRFGMAGSSEKEFVLTLDHSNFSETISKHEFVVVVFYAPWCENSKKVAPEYEKAASILSINHPQVILAKVDVNEDVNQEIANDHAVDGVPTLKIFRDGGKTIHKYNSRLDADGIVEYLKKQSGPVSVEIRYAEDASGLIGENSVVVVGIFPKFSGKEYDKFIALAKKLRSDYEFAHTRDAKLLPRGDSSVSGPLVRLFKPFNELFVDSKDFNFKALKKFLEESSSPLLTLLNNDPRQLPYVTKFFSNQNAKVILFLNFSKEVAESMIPKYREVAEQFKGHCISFLLVHLETGQEFFKYLGLKDEQVPVIVALSNDGQKYMKANIGVDDIAPWVKDYKDGKVARFTLSEPIPHDNSEPVKIVVGDSIDDVVFKSGKNVLIEFYDPSCRHCKRFAPILDEVALSLESDPNIVIAKFDANSNDITSDAFNVKDYPTVYFRSSTGTILLYDAEKTKEDIINFIKKNRVP